MNIPPSTSAQMGHCNCKSLGFIKKGLFPWILKVWFMILALFVTVTLEDKVEAPSSDDVFCNGDCATCPVICSPTPPSSPSAPHSPPSPFYFTFSPPPPKSQSPPTLTSHSAPPPPSKSYNTPPSPSGSSSQPQPQPQPTVIAGPHDYYHPYYYFSISSASSLSTYAPFFVLLLFLNLDRIFFCR